jgi:RNA polymerase sigma factor (sigma-70 family)
MTPDPELLSRYTDQRDEAAFAEFVRRHVKLVYGTALRLTNGDTPLAEDVTQAVFIDLARKAGQLRGHTTVAGWLHTGTRYAAANAIRREHRRRMREQEAIAMNDPTTVSDDPNWAQMRPLIDEAVGRLGEHERNAVLLYFFQEKSYREIGDALGVSEDAARMRIARALEKLRGQFARRGLKASAALIASALGANAAVAPAAGFSATLAQKSLAGAAVKAGAGKLSSVKVLALVAGVSALAATVTISFSPLQDSPATREKQPVAAHPAPAMVQAPAVAVTPANPVSLPNPIALAPVLASAAPAVAVLSQDVAASENAATAPSQAAGNPPAAPDSSTPSSQDVAPPTAPNPDTPPAAQTPTPTTVMDTGIAIFDPANPGVPNFVDTSGVLNGKTITAIANGGDHQLALCSDGTLVTFHFNRVRAFVHPSNLEPAGAVDNNRNAIAGPARSGATGGNNPGIPAPANPARSGLPGNGRNLIAGAAPIGATGGNNPVRPLPPNFGRSAGISNNGPNRMVETVPDGEQSVSYAVNIVPVLVDTSNLPAGAKIAAIAAGEGSNIAITSDGAVYVWGQGQARVASGQTIATRGRATAVAIPTLLNSGALKGRKATAIGVGAGGFFGVALCADGSLVAWGDNSDNQVAEGGGSAVGVLHQPKQINGDGTLEGRTIQAISTSWFDGLVLCADGSVVEWGAPNSLPVSVDTGRTLANKTIAAIAAGGAQSGLALCSDGTLAAWWQESGPPQNIKWIQNEWQSFSIHGEMLKGPARHSPNSTLSTSLLDGKSATAITERGKNGYLILCADGTLVTWNGGKPALMDPAGLLKGKTILAIAPDMVLFQEPDSASD